MQGNLHEELLLQSSGAEPSNRACGRQQGFVNSDLLGTLALAFCAHMVTLAVVLRSPGGADLAECSSPAVDSPSEPSGSRWRTVVPDFYQPSHAAQANSAASVLE